MSRPHDFFTHAAAAQPPAGVTATPACRRRSAAETVFACLRVLLSASLICALSCGKRRPPLPPVERVPQRTELLSGLQRGNRVLLSWPAPRRNASDESVQSIRRIDVYRLAEPVASQLPLTEEEFGARATLIGSVAYDTIQRSGETLSYTDELELTEPVRLRYALRYVNAAGQRAGFSNFLLVEPATRVSQPPIVSGDVTLTESAITVRWQPPAANVDGSAPPNLLGYNIYRTTRSQNEPGQTPLNGARPLIAAQYIDQSFAFGEEYVYVVRAVSLGTGGAPVESLNSNAITIAPLDTFPPQPPNGITIAATATRVSIFFAANPERDVVGYNIYRSTDPSLPKERWAQLNRTRIERTTFQDEAIESGVTYYYYLTAVDAANNVSQPSEVKSETVP